MDGHRGDAGSRTGNRAPRVCSVLFCSVLSTVEEEKRRSATEKLQGYVFIGREGVSRTISLIVDANSRQEKTKRQWEKKKKERKLWRSAAVSKS